MVDLLTPVREAITNPPTPVLGFGIVPGNPLSGSFDLPVTNLGTINPVYGYSFVNTTFPPAAGRSFAEVPTFARAWMKLTVWEETFDGFQIIRDQQFVRSAEGQIRWYFRTAKRLRVEIVPGFEAHFDSLIILG